MLKPISRISVLFVLSILPSLQDSTSSEQKNRIQPVQTQSHNQVASQNPGLSPDFGKIPLHFVPNRGQVEEAALFYAKTSRYTLWLTEEGLVFDRTKRIKKESAEPKRLNPREINSPEDVIYDRDVSKLVFINANRSVEVIPVDATEHKVNYFIGNDESKWRSNIQTSRAVLYKELYSSIDLKVYGIERQIEYDFVVKPGGEVSDIDFEYKNIEKTAIDREKNLIIKTKFGEIMHSRPVCYQVIRAERVEVQAEFIKGTGGDNNYGFRVEAYNRNYELIIDPVVLVYSTYLGGSGADYGRSIAVDSEGAAYVTGETSSLDFPTQNPIQGSNAGYKDVFITKLNASGSALIYSTYLGGSDREAGYGIAVDSEGATYVTGETSSLDFPTQNPIQGSNAGYKDVFIAKLNASGSALIYSTYLGGSDREMGEGIAVDSEGAAYVTGMTFSPDFPTRNPIQESNAGLDDVFVVKLNASGRALIYATYLGGYNADYGHGIAVDLEGAAYVTGETCSVDFPTQNPFQESNAGGHIVQPMARWDAFITKLNSSGSALIYSTYLGGVGEDEGWRIAVDSDGAVYVTGETGSDNFPTKNPIQETLSGPSDTFITKFNSSGSAIIYSTYLGGSSWEPCLGIAVDLEGAAYVTGNTSADDFPSQSPLQESNAGLDDVFVAKLNASGSALVYSTYLGGHGSDYGRGIAVDSEGAAYITGETSSADFPSQNPIQASYGGGDWDTFIAKLYFTPSLKPSLTITAGSGGTTEPSPGTYQYDERTEVTIRAIADTGYTFSGWSGAASGTANPITVTMDSDKSVTASFSKIPSDGDRGGGGCFIATACYGTSMAEEVKILSTFRDRYFMTNPTGKTIVKFYETHSPKVADFIRDKEDLKIIIRVCLHHVVWIINEFLSSQ